MPISIWSSIWFYFYYSSFLFFPSSFCSLGLFMPRVAFLWRTSSFIGSKQWRFMVFPMVSPVFRHSGRCVSVDGLLLHCNCWLALDSSDDDDMTSFLFCFWFFTLASLSLEVLVWMVSLDIFSSGVVARKKHYSNRIALIVIQTPFTCRMSEVGKGDLLYHSRYLLLELRASSRFELGGWQIYFKQSSWSSGRRSISVHCKRMTTESTASIDMKNMYDSWCNPTNSPFSFFHPLSHVVSCLFWEPE